MSASASLYPKVYKLYRGPHGYLCAFGNHYIAHEDADAMISLGVPPSAKIVNLSRYRMIAPPADGWHQPMHWSPDQRMAMGWLPMLLKVNCEPWICDQQWE